jgi:hypothetical protein
VKEIQRTPKKKKKRKREETHVHRLEELILLKFPFYPRRSATSTQSPLKEQ